MKFKEAKKYCHGFAAIDPSGKICRWTFVKRKGRVMSGNAAWAKIDGTDRADYTKDEYKNYIALKLEQGYKIVPINMVPLLDDSITINESLLYELLVRAYNAGCVYGFDGKARADKLNEILQMAKENVKYISDLSKNEPEDFIGNLI